MVANIGLLYFACSPLSRGGGGEGGGESIRKGAAAPTRHIRHVYIYIYMCLSPRRSFSLIWFVYTMFGQFAGFVYVAFEMRNLLISDVVFTSTAGINNSEHLHARHRTFRPGFRSEASALEECLLFLRQWEAECAAVARPQPPRGRQKFGV